MMGIRSLSVVAEKFTIAICDTLKKPLISEKQSDIIYMFVSPSKGTINSYKE